MDLVITLLLDLPLSSGLSQVQQQNQCICMRFICVLQVTLTICLALKNRKKQLVT